MPDVVMRPCRSTAAFECRVRYDGRLGPELAPAEIDRLCRFAEGKGREWGERICRFLGLDPHRSVEITLKQGLFVSMTRGSSVVIGVGPGTVSAALAHELVHAVAGPSARQLYGEGLAVWVDAELRLAGPAWPFFELDPDRWVRQFVDDGTFVPLATLLGEERVAPSQEDGLSAAARIYLEAGSLVGHAVGRFGLGRFWSYYHSGRALAGGGAKVAALEKSWLAGLGGSLGEGEQRLREAAVARMADDGRHGLLRAPLPASGPAR